MKVNPYQFTERVEFGTLEPGEMDANGQTEGDVFKPKLKVWFGHRQQTLNQQYTLEGLNVKYTKLIAIRHNNDIEEGMYAKIKGRLYQVLKVSADERNGNGLNTYDILTLQDVTKGGVGING
ncbi:phage head closure protein [Weissella viridescens]|uniref:phage head closure protein n=1 Tax=Weissella viridescens TaxID=1629 RepID=UPI001C7DF01E|nr:phage head closure protein [Weissella viridescens]MBX4172560.1 phage head closure protein [Weissella viridescens]